MNPAVRPPEEEWDPEYTPKSRKYYLVSLLSQALRQIITSQRIHVGAVNNVDDAALSFFQHDDRDGEKTWIDNRGRGRGAFPARRGRFVYRKGGSSPKWTHDMFQGGEEGGLGDDSMEVACKENSKNAGDAPTLKQ